LFYNCCFVNLVISKEKSPREARQRLGLHCGVTCGDLLRLFAFARVSFVEMTYFAFLIEKLNHISDISSDKVNTKMNLYHLYGEKKSQNTLNSIMRSINLKSKPHFIPHQMRTQRRLWRKRNHIDSVNSNFRKCNTKI
jgi:hypothetical protein